MEILIANKWPEYELLDSGNGQRLERFGKYTLMRPDPQCIWKPHLPKDTWDKADATYHKLSTSKGEWRYRTKLPHSWPLTYNGITMLCKLTSFKHTGVFPEQQMHWEWIENKVTNEKQQATREIRVLNLFGYTGGASLAAAKAGAHVTHLDASFPTIGWARENQNASKLNDKPIRWIEDDCLKFVEREQRRGNKYDAIIMDPPVFGHGPKGEVWEFTDDFPKLLDAAVALLSDTPLFVVVNAYAVSASSIMLENVLKDYCPQGTVTAGELALEETASHRLLSTGIYGRWEA